jgi:hypothetical protein
MYASHTYFDQLRTTEKIGPKGWGSLHRAYALGVLAVGGVASYHLRDINLAVASAILVSTWALIFQLIATTKLVHRSLMMIHASQERKVLAGFSEGRLTRPAESSVVV